MDSKKDISSEELLEQLSKLKKEVSGLREENNQMKKELSESGEDSNTVQDDFDDVINLDDVLKKIEKMKNDNSDFLSPVSKEETPVVSEVEKDFSIDESLSRLENLADSKEFTSEEPDVIKSTDLTDDKVIEAPIVNFGNELDEMEIVDSVEETPKESITLVLDKMNDVDLIEETALEIPTESIDLVLDEIENFDSNEETEPVAPPVSLAELLGAVKVVETIEEDEETEPTENISLELEEFQTVDSIGVTESEALSDGFTQSLKEVLEEAQSVGSTEEVDDESFTQALDKVIEEVQNFDSNIESTTEEIISTQSRSLDDILSSIEIETKNLDIVDESEETLDKIDSIDGKNSDLLELGEETDEIKSEILDIQLESREEQNEKLSLTMILADTQELNTFMVESEIEMEKQRRAAAKDFDPKSSNFDKDGNIVNPKKSSKNYIYIALAAAIIALILLIDTSLMKVLTDREDPQIELASEAVYVEVGQQYDLVSGIVVSDDKASEEYLMENLEIESQPEFSADTLGTYVVSYSVTDEGRNVANATQTIYVVPVGYELVLSVPEEDLVVQVGDEVNLMDGVTVSNGLDDPEELKSKVEISSEPNNFNTETAGNFEITYSISDSTGSVAVAKRNVIVEDQSSEPVEEKPTEESVDTTDPIVSITSPDVTIAAGEAYDATEGVYASDDVSSNDYVWSNMQMESSPSYDPNTPGTYYITFTFTDEAGNSTSAERVIRVK